MQMISDHSENIMNEEQIYIVKMLKFAFDFELAVIGEISLLF